MIELLNNYLYIVILYFPIGIIGLWRWSVWITKKIVARKYRVIEENGYSDTVSIVVPVYNEEPDIFCQALESWKNNNPDEIIAVIDYTDSVSIEKFKEFQKQNKNSKLIITKKSGKRGALVDGIRVAKHNIIVLVDSDTIWDPNIKSTLLAPFVDSSVGGVGPRQDVLNVDTLARRLFNIHLDHRYFDEITYLATVSNALTCISGRTAVYRKEAIKDVCDGLESETFWGVKCISGDDKCITRLVQEKGWKVRYQANARVLTPGAPDLLTLFKQHIRWTRNSYRSDLKTLMSGWVWKREKFLAFHMVDRFTQPFTLVIGPIYFIFSIIWGHWIVAVVLLVWWHFSRGIKLYPHFKSRPADILILPFYIFVTYFMALLKIYAMVTIRQQGWITRWDKGRMKSSVNNILRIFKTVSSYLAVFLVIFLLSFAVGEYKNATIVPRSNGGVEFVSAENFDIGIDTRQYRNAILDNLKNYQFVYYTVKKDDTLSKIARKYNGNLDVIIKSNEKTIQNPNHISQGQSIVIPISELKKRLDTSNLISFRQPSIGFNENKNTINIKGEGSIVNLSKIYESLDDKYVLEKLENNEWILRVDLLIGKGVTLVLDGNEVSWLKLLSESNNFITIRSYNGRILIKNSKVTSWDENIQNYDMNVKDGRSFILAKYDGRMDVVNSEIAFLGYGYYKVSSQEQPYGGSYGISWKLPDDSGEAYLLTGSIVNSKIHNNYFGAYVFGAVGMVFKDNEFYNNIQYGVDIHDGSSNLVIEGNITRDNGTHGIILSKQVINSIIRNNVSYNNKLHGIMLHEQSNANIIESNVVYDNTDGIVVYGSHNNLITRNIAEKNENGIRVNMNSSGNYIEQNDVINNNNGIFIYDDVDNNFVVDNSTEGNNKDIYAKNAVINLIQY